MLQLQDIKKAKEDRDDIWCTRCHAGGHTKDTCPNFRNYCYRDPQTHWDVLVYHGVAYVKSMGIDMRTVITCRRWLPKQNVCTINFFSQLDMTTKLPCLWFYPGKDVWFILCERWGPPNSANTTTRNTTNSTSAVYTTTSIAVCPCATTATVYNAAAVCTSFVNGGTTTI